MPSNSVKAMAAQAARVPGGKANTKVVPPTEPLHTNEERRERRCEDNEKGGSSRNNR
jgi:hypothetical protein